MGESTSFIEKIASSSPAMKGTTDINTRVKMSSTVYRFRISIVRKPRVRARVGFSTNLNAIAARRPCRPAASKQRSFIFQAYGQEHGYPRRDEEAGVADVQPVRCGIDYERVGAVVQGNLIDDCERVLAILLDHAQIARSPGNINSMEPGIVGY